MAERGPISGVTSDDAENDAKLIELFQKYE